MYQRQQQEKQTKCFTMGFDPADLEQPYSLPAADNTLAQQTSERRKIDDQRLCKKAKKAVPKKSRRPLHFHEKVNDPEVANEADRQLQEQLHHGLRNFYANYAMDHSNEDRDSNKKRCSLKSADTKETPKKDNMLCHDDLRTSLPDWARNVDLQSHLQCGWHSSQLKEHNEEENEFRFIRHQRVSTHSVDEDAAIPSWAQEVTINTLNETFSFLDERDSEENENARRQSRTMSRTSDYRNKKHARNKKRFKATNQDFCFNTLTNLTHLEPTHSTYKDMDLEESPYWPLEVNYMALGKFNEDFICDSYKNICSNSDKTQLTCPKEMTKERTCELQNYDKCKKKSTSEKCSRNTSDECSSSVYPLLPKSSVGTSVSFSPSCKSRKDSTSCGKGQEFISSLMRSPIEAFEKLMFYLMKPGVIDEEDITGVETFDEYESKPITISDGDNFLAFIKEKHLKQGIDYCNIAAKQTVEQFISKLKAKKLQNQQDLKTKLKDQVMNCAQTNTVKEIHEADEQIEVIGYVGCTGNAKLPTDQKQCNEGDDKDENIQQDFNEI